jgi:hypothetical protein
MLCAFHREAFDFRFSYPLDIVPRRGRKNQCTTARTVTGSPGVFRRMDTGVPRARGRLCGEAYNQHMSRGAA